MKKKLTLDKVKVSSFVTKDKVQGGVTTSQPAVCETLPCTTYTDAPTCPTGEFRCGF